MIIGIGYDLVEIRRIEKAMKRSIRFIERILTNDERILCLNEKNAVEKVAGRFAAKEAVAKSFGVPLRWHDVEIVPNGHGKPKVLLHNKALTASSGEEVLVSITHTKEHAGAMAVRQRVNSI